MPHRITVSAVLALLALLGGFRAQASTNETDVATLWMAKSAGIWKSGDRYGYYKALVFREGIEAAKDKLLIVITQVDPKNNTQEIIKKYWLNTPGIKGFVTGLAFNMITEDRMALSVDIEMKAMEGIVLREIFLLGPDGSFKRITNADYVDVFK